MASRSVYCICGEPYDSVRFMIQCDACRDWYHGSCVNVKEHESLDIEKYHCVQCQPIYGPSVYKEIKNWHRHDYGDSDAQGKAVQSGTPVFVKELRSRHFKNGDEVVLHLRGPSLNLPYLMQNGFNFPILVDSKVGLGLQVPPDTFTVSDVLDYVGSDFSLDVIDVTRQENIKMCMKEWVEYFNCPVRNKVYNVISLEFSTTKLSEIVKPPVIVQKLSWVENCWPKNLPQDFPVIRPQVMKYCLMSAGDSYTDFHIDFGGTSVWYHILKGEKVFFLVRPTPANLALYEHWSASSNQSETFFGDQVDACYQLVLSQGQTLFIPTGWIHSVFTPVDSLVFGGNFLHSMNIPLQLQIHEMEKRISTPEKYKFPNFETVHWFAAPHILEQLRDFNLSKRELQHLIVGAKALVNVLRAWSADSQNNKHEDIPPGINVAKLLKDLQREVRTAEKFSVGKNAVAIAKKPPPRLRKQKDLSIGGQRYDLQVPQQVEPENLSLHYSLTQQYLNNFEAFSQRVNSNALNITMPEMESSENVLRKFTYPPNMPQQFYDSMILKNSMPEERNDIYKFMITSGGHQAKELPDAGAKGESVYDFVDSDEDNLIVDEAPPTRRRKMIDFQQLQRTQGTEFDSKRTAIKLKLSLNGKAMDDDLIFKQPLMHSTADDMVAEARKNATIDDLLLATGLATDADNSLDDEDGLSGGRTSPSTREAIQGMLSISKSAFLFANQDPTQIEIQPSMQQPPPTQCTTSGSLLPDNPMASFSILAKKSSPLPRGNSYSSSKARHVRPRYNDDDDDFEESLKQCHQDSDYIYLGLEASDDEFHVFKPRGKNRRDEPWNPKAKLVPNGPKPERPVREGVRKEAVESGLAAAAAKLATMPPPKRQYLKKKIPLSKSKVSASHHHAGPSSFGKRPLTSDSTKANKKPKKGFATAKQRLGKILKIHKMLY